jgi:hypothetical protein
VLAQPGQHQDACARQRQQVLAERPLEQPDEDQDAGPRAGDRNHHTVAERQVEAPALRPRAQQRQHAQRHHDLGRLDERERTEGADQQQ